MKILLLIVGVVAVVTALPNPWMKDFPTESIDTMIDNFKRLAIDFQRTGYWDTPDYDPNSPFKKIIYRKVPQSFNKEIDLPVYLHAKIKSSHLQDLPSRSGIPRDIYNLMEAKDSRINDEVGHLLAYSLGGGMGNALNYIPMAICLNRGPYLKTEQEIGAFLKKHRDGEVDWHLVVIYEKKKRNKQGAFDSNVDLNSYNLRPIGLCLKYKTKTSATAPEVIGDSKCFYNILHDPLDQKV